MDDFIVWTNVKTEISTVGNSIALFLEDELDLKLKTFYAGRTEFGLSFLSYKLFPNKILLTRKAKKRYIYKMKEYEGILTSAKWTQEKYAVHVRALTAFTEHAFTRKFRNKSNSRGF